MSLREELSAVLGDRLQLDASLGALTTYRIGGSAAFIASVESEDELRSLAQALSRNPVPVAVLGRGSNTLVADQGFAGLVLTLGKSFGTIEFSGSQSVLAGGRVDLPVLARSTVDRGLGGLEWAVGVPGTVGGGIAMNAGGHGSDIRTSLERAWIFRLSDAKLVERSTADLLFSYRYCALASDEIVLRAQFFLRTIEAEVGRERMREIVRWRREHQPGGTNAGSVFTNPPDESAGRLIDQAGLAGLRMGSAQVSSKHANFIQADPEGKAADVVQLMIEVRELILARTGVSLRPETKLLGFPPESLEALGVGDRGA
ncbi:MAG: UDP-N-acetylmuramate dehydrogenase [Actinobacteria bacterium]|nr:UDP-N-acetylmuramate dehydrogenase [Actinomycetota bacterium]